MIGNDMLRIGLWLSWALLALSGCGDFFAEKPTELQSRSILRDLGRIETVPDPNIQVPAIYQAPPEIMEVEKGVKLFYFSRYHSVEKLNGIITQQLGNVVTLSRRVNQLIIHCDSVSDARTVLAFIREIDVAPIQVKIDCLVSELYADTTMDWETTIKIDELFGEDVALSGRVDETGTLLPAFPGAALREPDRQNFGLKVGYIKERGGGNEFRTLVDLLVSRGYLKILMNPSLEVVNGEMADIRAEDYVPLPIEKTTRLGAPYMTTEYSWVTDSLEVTPHVYAGGFIGLETTVKISSTSTPEGVKQESIITERTIINKEIRIRQGDSLVIGGLRKKERRSVVRGVPFLKDIPLLGILFSSKDYEERTKEILFVITPMISDYGIPNKEMMDRIRLKHDSPIPEPLFESVGGAVSEFLGASEDKRTGPPGENTQGAGEFDPNESTGNIKKKTDNHDQNADE